MTEASFRTTCLRVSGRVGVLIILGMVWGGCRDSSGDAQTNNLPPTGGTVDPGVSQIDSDLVALQDYLRHGETLLVEKCMKQAGLPYFSGASSPQPEARELFSGIVLVPLDQNVTTQVGYNLQGSAASDAQESEARQVQALSASEQSRYQLTMFGDATPGNGMVSVVLPDGSRTGMSPTGCLASARLAIYSSLETYLTEEYIFQSIDAEVTSRIVSSNDYPAVLGEWSLCMKKLGFDVADPSAALSAVRQAYEGSGRADVVLPIDISTATADAQCQAQSRMIERFNALKKRVVDSVSEERHGELLSYREFLMASQDRAREALGT